MRFAESSTQNVIHNMSDYYPQRDTDEIHALRIRIRIKQCLSIWVKVNASMYFQNYCINKKKGRTINKKKGILRISSVYIYIYDANTLNWATFC